jgi:hypothetical protein
VLWGDKDKENPNVRRDFSLKREKIQGSPEILTFFEELVQILENDKQRLFPR